MNNRKNLDAEMASASQGLQGPQGRKFWRSLEELAGSEAFQKLMREFPEQGVVWSDGLSRRQFLTLMAASLALAGVGGCGEARATGRVGSLCASAGGAHPVDRPLFYATAMACTGAAVGCPGQCSSAPPPRFTQRTSICPVRTGVLCVATSCRRAAAADGDDRRVLA